MIPVTSFLAQTFQFTVAYLLVLFLTQMLIFKKLASNQTAAFWLFKIVEKNREINKNILITKIGHIKKSYFGKKDAAIGFFQLVVLLKQIISITADILFSAQN